MDIHTDVWSGESLVEITQIMTEFRFQLDQYSNYDRNTLSLSEALVNLQDYLSNDAIVIVANDSNQFSGYIALVDITDDHPKAMPYAYLAPDVKVSGGPLVHPNYRDARIDSQLLIEAMNECSLRDIRKLKIDLNQDPLIDNQCLQALLKKNGFTEDAPGVWGVDIP